MRVQLLSDVHFEHHPNLAPYIDPGADIVVLAGDIGSYQEGSLLQTSDFGLSHFSPLLRGAPDQVVLFVPGNHEFDALDYECAQVRMKQICSDMGITWLDREVIKIGGVRFVGTTLWSDFEALAVAEKTPESRARARQEALAAADDYLRRNSLLRFGSPVLSSGVRDLAIESQTWLRSVLSSDFDGKTVVVTHFAPSLKSADPRYGITPMTAGFCNSLDGLMSKADLWIHGHVHHHHDYEVTSVNEQGQHRLCRVVANPFGYLRKEEQKSFQSGFVLSI